MSLIATKKLDGKEYLEFELKLCKIYDDRRHINQTCHNNFDHCWKNARDEQSTENAIAKCIALYTNYEPHVTGEFFDQKEI